MLMRTHQHLKIIVSKYSCSYDFKDGQKISEKMGALPKSALETWIKDTI